MNQAKAIDIRGRTLGAATPLICSPLVARTAAGLLDEAAVVMSKQADVVEWRVDFFDGIDDTGAVLAAAKALRQVIGDTPLIFTRRSSSEGGQAIALDEAAVVRLYEIVGASGLVDVLDFEMGNDAEQVRQVVAAAHAQGLRVILSYHNFRRTPDAEFLVQRFLEAERLGGDVAKVAVMPRDRGDVLTLLAATAAAEAKARVPLISMSMGRLGAVTRMIGGEFGSSLSFAVGEGSSAPGQLPIADLKLVYEVLQRAHRVR